MMFIGCTSYSRQPSPVIRRLISRFIPTAVDNLVDLCSIANISVLFFDTPFHGYYIHGVNPTAKSDTNLKGLVESLNMESQGKSQKRGLDPNDYEGLQTFEIYIPVELRKAYDKVRAAHRDHQRHPKPERGREASRRKEEEERAGRQVCERQERKPVKRGAEHRDVGFRPDRRRHEAHHAGEQPVGNRGSVASPSTRRAR